MAYLESAALRFARITRDIEPMIWPFAAFVGGLGLLYLDVMQHALQGL